MGRPAEVLCNGLSSGSPTEIVQTCLLVARLKLAMRLKRLQFINADAFDAFDAIEAIKTCKVFKSFNVFKASTALKALKAYAATNVTNPFKACHTFIQCFQCTCRLHWVASV